MLHFASKCFYQAVFTYVSTNPTYPDISFTAFLVPRICEPLSHQMTEAAKIDYHHLKGLTLADLNTGDDELEIDRDIYVGSDQCWTFMTGCVRRGVFGPNAVETKLGLVLSADSTSSETCSVMLTSAYKLF